MYVNHLRLSAGILKLLLTYLFTYVKVMIMKEIITYKSILLHTFYVWSAQ